MMHVDGNRLWDSLMRMAEIGATKGGGNCRLALSDRDKMGRDLFISWASEIGCSIDFDDVGNLIARYPGLNNALPPIAMGSHLDTQPNGGRFDGVYGVLAGLEVMRTLHDHSFKAERPIEVIAWTNEEGSRFPPAMMGSGVFIGELDLDHTLATTDANGVSVKSELERHGYKGKPSLRNHPIAAYIEAHIEQGPILENQDKTIGVVTGVQGIRWYDIEVHGIATHAGPTPMEMRSDALELASHLVLDILAIAKIDGDARATIGEFNVSPGSRNVVPDKVSLTVDLRHPNSETLSTMHNQLHELIEQACVKKKGWSAQLTDIWYSPPVNFDHNLVNSVRNGANDHNYSYMEIVSGAGHDAVYLSKVSSTSMIFIPCAGGVSHNEAESASKDDVIAGANVLLHAIHKFLTE